MSQCAAILRVLRDGQPHSVRTIHERAGFSRLNSRITDLRKAGYDIEHRVIEAPSQVDRHVYQLLASPPARPVVADGEPDTPAEQLTLEMVA